MRLVSDEYITMGFRISSLIFLRLFKRRFSFKSFVTMTAVVLPIASFIIAVKKESELPPTYKRFPFHRTGLRFIFSSSLSNSREVWNCEERSRDGLVRIPLLTLFIFLLRVI